MIRVSSPLDEQPEKYVKETMDCGYAVHKALGPGFLEATYKNAFCVELSAQNIPFECEKPITVHVHEAQVLAYLKASQLPIGLLMNFGGARLKEGFRRIIL